MTVSDFQTTHTRPPPLSPPLPLKHEFSLQRFEATQLGTTSERSRSFLNGEKHSEKKEESCFLLLKSNQLLICYLKTTFKLLLMFLPAAFNVFVCLHIKNSRMKQRSFLQTAWPQIHNWQFNLCANEWRSAENRSSVTTKTLYSPLRPTRDCVKDISTQAQDQFVKLLSVNTTVVAKIRFAVTQLLLTRACS